MDILLQDLSPFTQYTVQVRSKREGAFSQWSPSFSFITDKDDTPPNPVTSLVVNPVGTSFVATWVAPNSNADGEPLTDFSHYIVEVEANGLVAKYRTVDLRFDFTLEMNSSVFLGPKSSVAMRVFAIDQTGNSSVSSGDVVSQNAPPGDIAAPTVTPQADGIMVRWTGSTVDDLRTHNIYLATGASPPAAGTVGTLIASEPGTSFFYPTLTYATKHYFSVRAVDHLGSTSVNAPWSVAAQPTNYNTVDATAPNNPTALVLTKGVNKVTVSFTQSSSTDVVGHRLRYRAGTAPWEYMEIGMPSGTTANPWPIITDLPAVLHTVEVQAYDASLNFPLTWLSGTVTPDNAAAPAATVGVGGTVDPTRITVFWDRNIAAVEYEVKLYGTSAARTAGTPVLQTKIATGGVAVFSGLTPETAYYLTLRAKDSNGNYETTQNLATLTTGAAGTGTINFGDIEGTVGEEQFATNSIRADSLKVDTSITRRLIVGAATYDTTLLPTSTNGELVSGNFYTATGAPTGTLIESGSGFRLTHNSLVINSGTIDAKAVQLQAGANIAPARYAGFEFEPNSYVGQIAYSGGSGTISTVEKRYQTQSLLITNTRALGDVTASYAFMGATTVDYNIALDPDFEYIISAWVYNPNAEVISVALRMRHNETGGYLNTAATDIQPGVWTRLERSGGVGASTMGMLAVYNYSPQKSFYVDGMQVEVKTSGQTTASPWAPPGSTRLDGGIIRTGEIRSNLNQTIDGVDTPAWALNLAGDMQINSALVRGNMVIGSSANPTSGTIQSHQFVAGTTPITGAGWQIRANGGVEFNDARIRGTIYATAGEFTGKVTAATGQIANWTINSGNLKGNAGTTTEVGLSTGTNAFWAGGTEGTAGTSKFNVTALGALKATGADLSGKVTATSGAIGNWTIDSLGITGSGRINGGSIQGSDMTVSNNGFSLLIGPSYVNPSFFSPTISWSHTSYYSKNPSIFAYRYALVLGGPVAAGSGNGGVSVTIAEDYVAISGGNGSPRIQADSAGVSLFGACTVGNSTILTLGNKDSYTFTPTSHGSHIELSDLTPLSASTTATATSGDNTTAARSDHRHATAGSVESSQPNWTGTQTNGVQMTGLQVSHSTSHNHSSTSHTHTVTL